MTNSDPTSLPVPTYAGGTTAITKTPVVGTPRPALLAGTTAIAVEALRRQTLREFPEKSDPGSQKGPKA